MNPIIEIALIATVLVICAAVIVLFSAVVISGVAGIVEILRGKK